MQTRTRTTLFVLPAPAAILLAIFVHQAALLAEDEATAASELALDQSRIAERYQRVEKLILRMAEFDQASNPRRAELLKRAFAMGKDRDIHVQLKAVSRLLNQDKFKRALDGQSQARQDLQALLDLLLTENRTDRLKDEQARVRDYIREIERLERMQRSVQARTEGGVEADQIQDEQNRVADRAEALHQRIEESEGQSQSGDAEDDEQRSTGDQEVPSDSGEPSESGDGQSSDSEDSEDGEANGEKSDADESDKQDRKPPIRDNPLRPKKPRAEEDKQPSDSDDANSKGLGQESEGESQDGQPPSSDSAPQENESQPKSGGQPGPPSESQSPSNNAESQDAPAPSENEQSFPGQQRVEEAERHMREAERRLAEAKRDGALEEQQQAAKKLAEAKAELEEILRQMREEEIERVLATLEVRFRKMLEMQLRVYEATMRVDKIPAESRDRFIEIEAGKLSFQEKRIVVEADKCLNLLREEGSSVAFPETVQQMRDDMQLVSQRLAKSEVGRLTQGIEEDVIEALEEMIAAMEKVQADQEERKQNSPGGGGQSPGDMPLVDAIAELKMLKSLQLRINRRTTRYSMMLDDTEDPVGQVTDEDLILSVQDLSDRQKRLHKITRDIALGRNK